MAHSAVSKGFPVISYVALLATGLLTILMIMISTFPASYHAHMLNVAMAGGRPDSHHYAQMRTLEVPAQHGRRPIARVGHNYQYYSDDDRLLMFSFKPHRQPQVDRSSGIKKRRLVTSGPSVTNSAKPVPTPPPPPPVRKAKPPSARKAKPAPPPPSG